MRPSPIVAQTHDVKVRLTHWQSILKGVDGGAWQLGYLRVIASVGEGWEHVSVSRIDQTPCWEEMEFVKRCFFYPHETVMQLHVPEAEHVNHHPYCLHLWRPVDGVIVSRSPEGIPRPPNELVGAP